MKRNMQGKHVTPLNALLAKRSMNGKELAQRLDTTESTVSGWRRGLIPSESNRKRIYAELACTEQEIATLGWEREPAGV